MSSQGFSFPPPPPPPPVSQQHAPYPSTRGNGHWNGRGAGGGRGRGRGHGSRGRGGHYSSDAPRASYPNLPGYNSTPGNFGYPAQPVPSAPFINPSHYPHAQPNFQSSPNPAYPPAQPYSQPAGSAPYHHQPLPGYNGPANLAHPAPYPSQSAPAYPPPVPTPQHASPPHAPVMMGSIHWGAEAHPSYGAPPPSYGHGHGHGPGPGAGPSPSRGGHRGGHSHGNHGPKQRNSNKRDHTSAFHKPQSTVPKVPAPPAVPSFGNPLPCKPPPAADASRKQKKRKRKHNQLGLTPKTEEHESSEEEEEVDEEAKLGADNAPLQITYKGRTATLQSSSDIAAWIAERKKKFPTQARIAEKQKAAEEAKAARDAAREATRREKEQEREREREKETAKSPGGRKLSDAQAPGDPVLDAAMKAQRKADKIRRTLDREQKRFAKAEAEAEAARLKVEALRKQVQGLKQGQPGASTEPSGSSAALNVVVEAEVTDSTEIPQESASLLATDSHLGDLALPDGMDDSMDLMSDGDGPEGSDWTSSSGSHSESDSESDDSAPEEISSRREGPERVAPPPREGKKPLCRHFARSGQCNRGDKCKFSHEVSERPKHKSGDKDKNEKKGRKGLFQALLDQQKAEEDKRAMEVISWLGQHGMLEAAQPNGAPPSETPA